MMTKCLSPPQADEIHFNRSQNVQNRTFPYLQTLLPCLTIISVFGRDRNIKRPVMFWPLGSIWVFWKCPYFMTNKAVSSPASFSVRTPCLRQKARR
jgi:hypothetical protein